MMEDDTLRQRPLARDDLLEPVPRRANLGSINISQGERADHDDFPNDEGSKRVRGHGWNGSGDGAESDSTAELYDSAVQTNFGRDNDKANHITFDLWRWQSTPSPNAAETAVEELRQLAPGYEWAVTEAPGRGRFAFGRPLLRNPPYTRRERNRVPSLHHQASSTFSQRYVDPPPPSPRMAPHWMYPPPRIWSNHPNKPSYKPSRVHQYAPHHTYPQVGSFAPTQPQLNRYPAPPVPQLPTLPTNTYPQLQQYPYNAPPPLLNSYPSHQPYIATESGGNVPQLYLPAPPQPSGESRVGPSNGTKESLSTAESSNGVYEFTLPGHPKTVSNLEKNSNVSSSGYQGDWKQPHSGAPLGLSLDISANTIASRYTGEGFAGGMHQIELKTTLEANLGDASLFRWVHIQDPLMLFDEFQKKATQIPGLTDTELSALNRLLISAKHRYNEPVRATNPSKVRLMKPSFLQEQFPTLEQALGQDRGIKIATWICLPFFILDQYRGHLTKLSPGSYPLRTLLQARSLSTRKERDLQQAVCNLPNNPSGHCFHIAQLWSVVLDTSLLISCAPLPANALQQDVISVIPHPMSGTLPIESQYVIISYGESVLWSIPVEECRTWFGLIKHFCAFWPQGFMIKYNSQEITANEWPLILETAERAHRTLRLSFYLRAFKAPLRKALGFQHTQLPPQRDKSDRKGSNGFDTSSQHSKNCTANFKGSLNVDTQKPPNNYRGEKRQQQSQKLRTQYSERNPCIDDLKDEYGFYVLVRFHENEQVGISTNKNQLQQDLQSIDSFLSYETAPQDRIAYRNCTSTSYKMVCMSLQNQQERHAKSSLSGLQMAIESKIDVFNAFESVFEFFLPLSSNGPTVSKYWGALATALQIPSPASLKDWRIDYKVPQIPSMAAAAGFQSRRDKLDRSTLKNKRGKAGNSGLGAPKRRPLLPELRSQNHKTVETSHKRESEGKYSRRFENAPSNFDSHTSSESVRKSPSNINDESRRQEGREKLESIETGAVYVRSGDGSNDKADHDDGYVSGYSSYSWPTDSDNDDDDDGDDDEAVDDDDDDDDDEDYDDDDDNYSHTAQYGGQNVSDPDFRLSRNQAEASPIGDGGWDLYMHFKDTIQKMQAFREILSHAKPREQDRFDVPNELVKAWLHVVMAIVTYPGNPFSWREHLDRASKLLLGGMKVIMESMGKTSILENMMVMPMDLAAVFSLNCLRDFVSSRRDICDSYTECIKQIESEIELKPLQRQHQEKLSRLRQEIAVILETLDSQQQILDGMSKSINQNFRQTHREHGIPPNFIEIVPKPKSFQPNFRENKPATPATRASKRKPDDKNKRSTSEEKEIITANGKGTETPQCDHSRLITTNPRGFRDLFTHECLDLIGARLQMFTEMNRSALDLERHTMRMISKNKDHQEAAIYIFTVVTIIFLPISTVAGIFGMNTNDIRNMDANQWAFWVVAIPLSTIVIILCLAWAGYLSSFGIRIASLRSKRKN